MQKKAGIITHYNVHNHGAVLQLFSLSRVLKSMGYDAKALQFDKNYDFFVDKKYSDRKYNISIKSIPYYIKFLLKKGFKRTVFNVKKRRVLSVFRKKEDLIGEYYSTANDLSVVVIGSDEIFSIEAGPNPWYYGIGVPCKKQLSYAASFGPTTIDSIFAHNVDGLIKGGLDNISFVSVRDENSKKIVEYFTGKKTEIVCDPVLLYGHFICEQKDKIINQKQKYCVVYSYDDNMNDEQTIQEIKEYARASNLKIVSIGYYHGWCDKNIVCKPLDVFEWFKRSEFVFTDTFHGSVISMVTNAQFVAKIRGNGNKLRFLLDQYGLSDRIVNHFANIEIPKTNIDYSSVNKRINVIREKSLLFLRNSLDLLCGDE